MPESIFQARRNFLKVATSSLLGLTLINPSDCLAQSGDFLATVVDIDLCDGCNECVKACRQRSDQIMPMPQIPFTYRRRYHFVRDWSKGSRHLEQGILTPYNWLAIQEVKLSLDQRLYIPRRCMHCLRPTCSMLCSSGALTRERMGAVYVQPNLCIGDGSCTMNCPWHIPWLQSGVGDSRFSATQELSRMFKCDYCVDLQLKGQKPLCIQACTKGAMQIGPYEEMVAKARALAEEKGSNEIFGLNENGGTLTLYVTKHKLRNLEIALLENKGIRPGLPTLRVADRPIDQKRLLTTLAATPLAAVVLAGLRLWRDGQMR